MAVLLHKWEFKNTEVEFLKVSEKIWSPRLPDIEAKKSWDFLILTVSASTDDSNSFFQSLQNSSNSSRKQIFKDFFSYFIMELYVVCTH